MPCRLGTECLIYNMAGFIIFILVCTVVVQSTKIEKVFVVGDLLGFGRSLVEDALAL